MAGEIPPAVLKKTQDTLGKFVRRPPLTEKLLRKPPFRFLHDIITTVVRETKFFDGLFSDDEMNSENVTDKESKITFLQKVIDVVNIACGVSLSVRPSKVVAGYEPEKTNELLQIIGRAIEKKVDSTDAVQRVLSKAKGSKEGEQANAKQSQSKREDQVKTKKATAAQPPEKKPPKDKAGVNVSKQKVPKGVQARGEGKEKRPLAATMSKEDKRVHTSSKEKKPHQKSEGSAIKDTKSEVKSKAIASKQQKKSLDDNTLKTDGSEGVARKTKSDGREAAVIAAMEGARGEEEDPSQRKGSMGDALEAVEDLLPSLEPPSLSERENILVVAAAQDAAKSQVEESTMPGVDTEGKVNSAKRKQTMSALVNEELRLTSSSGQRMAISMPVVHPSSAVLVSVSRPRSSRPHAPRLRSALGGLVPALEDLDNKGKPKKDLTDGGLAGDMEDNALDGAEEFLVEEARLPSPSAPVRKEPAEVERRAEGGIEGSGMEEEQGVLVAKILETKKELEEYRGVSGEGIAPRRVEIEYGEEEAQRRRKGVDEVEILQSLVQSIARAAHPLGSLLAVLHENVDSMRMEMSKWRTECEHLLKLLKDEEKQMEEELVPLRLVLSEVEQRVVEEREAVSAAKARVLKAEQRIQAMLDPKGNAHFLAVSMQAS